MSKKVVAVISVLLLFTCIALAATSVGRGLADRAGNGSISGEVDPSIDTQLLTDEITDNVQLTNGARPTRVDVRDGRFTIEFAGAPAGAEVEALLPDQLARRLAGFAVTSDGSGGTAAIAGGGAAAVTGGVLGGLAAAGEFDAKVLSVAE